MYLFNPKATASGTLSPEVTGRNSLSNWLEKEILQLADRKIPFFNLLIGPGGTGKTHLLQIMYSKILGDKKLSESLVIAFLKEEEYGLDGYLDLIVRMFQAIAWHSTDTDESAQISQYLIQLQETNPEFRIYQAEQFLQHFLKDRSLLVFVENLDTVFKGLKEEGQSKWRDYIQKYDNTSILATSRAIFDDVSEENKAFFNFFNISYLENLSFSKSMDLLQELAKSEDNKPLIDFLSSNQAKSQIKAINLYLDGNPRLLTAFFNYLDRAYPHRLYEAFLQTLDCLQPYYKSLIQNLAPQQQKIVQHLAIQRNPQSGKQIALDCFISPTTLSKQLSQLQKMSVVDSHKIGRDSYYELRDPMLRLALEFGEPVFNTSSRFLTSIGKFFEHSSISTQQQLNGTLLNLNEKTSREHSTTSNNPLIEEWNFSPPHTFLKEIKYPNSTLNVKKLHQDLKARHYQNATAYLEKYISEKPNSGPAWLGLSLLYLQQFKIGKAKKAAANFARHENQKILHQAYLHILLNNLSALGALIKNGKEEFIESVFTLVLHFGSKTFIAQFLQDSNIKNWLYQTGQELEALLLNSIFQLIAFIDKIETAQLESVLEVFAQTCLNESLAKKYLSVAMRRVKQKEERALYDLTKEERKVLDSFLSRDKKS